MRKREKPKEIERIWDFHDVSSFSDTLVVFSDSLRRSKKRITIANSEEIDEKRKKERGKKKGKMGKARKKKISAV